MGARGFLVLGAALLLLAWTTSAAGFFRAVPAFVRHLIDAVFIFAAVRVGLSIAILAFDLSPASIAIPVALGLLALWLRPGR